MGFAFKFYGGAMNGQTVIGECGTDDLQPELAQRYWVESRFGMVGHHFQTEGDESSPSDDYEIISRSGSEEELLVIVACRSKPKD